jgi:hypothetical protein
MQNDQQIVIYGHTLTTMGAIAKVEAASRAHRVNIFIYLCCCEIGAQHKCCYVHIFLLVSRLSIKYRIVAFYKNPILGQKHKQTIRKSLSLVSSNFVRFKFLFCFFSHFSHSPLYGTHCTHIVYCISFRVARINK